MNTKITEGEIKIPTITGLATIAAVNTKVTDIENKLPDIANLVTKAALNVKATETENKILNTSSFITTPEFHRLTKISFDARKKETEKSFASKTEVKIVLDLGDENRRKNGKT